MNTLAIRKSLDQKHKRLGKAYGKRVCLSLKKSFPRPLKTVEDGNMNFHCIKNAVQSIKEIKIYQISFIREPIQSP